MTTFQRGLNQIQHSLMGPHFRFKPLQTSRLTSNLICQHPISVLSCSCAAELILQYGLDMGHVRYSAANHQARCVAQGRAGSMGTERTNAPQRTAGLCHPVILWFDIENNLPVNPSPSLQRHSKNTPNSTHRSQSTGDVKERGVG